MKTNVYKPVRALGMVFLMALLVLSGSKADAQEVYAVAVMDTNEILIGDQIELLLLVETSPGITVDLPILVDVLVEGIEIISQSEVDTSYASDSNIKLSKTYLITSFDSGFYAIPPFLITLLGDSNVIAETEALLLTVRTLEVDTTQAIMDIKAPLEAPYTIEELLPYAITIVAIILLLLLAYRLYKKYMERKKEPEIPEVLISPYIKALENLKTLENKKLWQNNKVKLYYTELTEIVRTYIEESFGIIAMEMTSDEILASIDHVGIEGTTKTKLRQILSQADMVKFAKGKPLASDHELSLQNGYDFVNESKPSDGVADDTKELTDNHDGAVQ
ncbi:MAG: hypothetical protein COB85_02810 [Bacteroidetes bacterium]|nr:MAG: hypothetical protein COB85_02810 [Bacteroidota bacterium]